MEQLQHNSEVGGLIREGVRGERLSTTRQTSRRQYQQRKAAGVCVAFGCSAFPKYSRLYCGKHLQRMSKENRKRIRNRKEQGLCIYCGVRPQFWGVRCIICRQHFVKGPLPFGARRALRLYREAETDFKLELLQATARFGIRKLLASGDIKGQQAKALRLYAGLDRGRWRTYTEVGKLMHITKERVRQLLKPSKILLADLLGNETPWKRIVK